MAGDDTVPNRALVEEGNTEAIVGLSVRIRAMEKSLSYGNTQIEELRKEVNIANRTGIRIEQAFSTYETYLKESLESQKFWAGVRDDAIKHVSKSLVLLVIMGFLGAMWIAAKVWAKELISGL